MRSRLSSLTAPKVAVAAPPPPAAPEGGDDVAGAQLLLNAELSESPPLGVPAVVPPLLHALRSPESSGDSWGPETEASPAVESKALGKTPAQQAHAEKFKKALAKMQLEKLAQGRTPPQDALLDNVPPPPASAEQVAAPPARVTAPPPVRPPPSFASPGGDKSANPRLPTPSGTVRYVFDASSKLGVMEAPGASSKFSDAPVQGRPGRQMDALAQLKAQRARLMAGKGSSEGEDTRNGGLVHQYR